MGGEGSSGWSKWKDISLAVSGGRRCGKMGTQVEGGACTESTDGYTQGCRLHCVKEYELGTEGESINQDSIVKDRAH